MGQEYILVNISIDYVDSVKAGDLERSIAALDQQIKQHDPRVKRVFVEAESRYHRKH